MAGKDPTDSLVGLDDLLNAQTGRIGWQELDRFFARGVVVLVSADEDLVDVAECLVRDREAEVRRLYDSGSLRRALDDDAIRWHSERAEFWAVVVAPWVLVQEI